MCLFNKNIRQKTTLTHREQIHDNYRGCQTLSANSKTAKIHHIATADSNNKTKKFNAISTA